MTSPTDPIPADQAMLLRLIDSKFETNNAKLDGISATLKAMADRFTHYEKRFDDHEGRLSTIEAQMVVRQTQVLDFEAFKKKVAEIDIWKVQEETTTRNAGRWGGVVWSLVGSSITGFIIWGIGQYHDANKVTVNDGKGSVEHQLTAKELEEFRKPHR